MGQLAKEALQYKYAAKASKKRKSNKLVKVIESVETAEVNTDTGTIVLDDINEKPAELDAILEQYKLGYGLENLINLVKSDFNVSVIFNLSEDASEVVEADVIITDPSTIVKVLEQFAEYGAGSPAEIETLEDEDETYFKVKLFNDKSLPEEE